MRNTDSSNHLPNRPPPTWSILPTTNAATSEPQALVSHTPVLTIRVAQHGSPKRLSLYFESFTTGHLFPCVHIKAGTRTVFVKLRHSSLHRGLVSEEVIREMGGPIQEQYIITQTRHEFELPEEYSTTTWSWRRFRAPNGPGPGGRGGTHVLEVVFREDLHRQAKVSEMHID